MEYYSPYLDFDGMMSSSVFRSLLIILFFLLHAVNVPVDVLNNFVYYFFYGRRPLHDWYKWKHTLSSILIKVLISPFLHKIYLVLPEVDCPNIRRVGYSRGGGGQREKYLGISNPEWKYSAKRNSINIYKICTFCPIRD